VLSLNQIPKNRISIFLLFFFSIFVGTIFNCQRRADNNGVLARVGNTKLTRETLDQQLAWEGMNPDRESDFVERWVNRELLYQEARRLGMDKTPDLKWELEIVEKEFLVQKLIERTFMDKIHVTEEEIASYYEKNKDLFIVQADMVRALHILTKTQEEANLALREIRAGKPFEEVAKEKSIGPFHDKGGDLGFIKRNDVIPEISRNAFRLTAGRESRVFSSNYGFHIIKVLKKHSKGDVKDLVDVQEEIIQRLRVSKERSVYYDLLYQLQNKSKVFIAIPDRSNQTASSDSE